MKKGSKFKFQYCQMQVYFFYPNNKFYYVVKFLQICLAIMTRQHTLKFGEFGVGR